MARLSLSQSLFTLVIVALLASTSALYTKKGPVSQLTTRTFSKAVLDSDLPAIVEFYAPWCGHCKSLAPHYQKVAENLQGIATVAAVDCDNADNQPLCGEYKVQGFPTLKIFPANKPKASAKSRKKLPNDYNGPRTAKGIADALTSALPASQISKVKDAKGFSNFTSATSLPKVVLFTDKSRTSALYKSLSLRFKDRLAFAEVSSKAADVVEAQGITQVPKLVVMKTDQVEEYSGKFKAAELISFLSEQAGSAADTEADEPASQGSRKGTGQKEKQKQEEKEDPKIVRDLNVTEFEGLSDEEDAWLVAFYSDAKTGSSKCSKELTDWNKVNFQLGGVTLVGQVNVSAASAAEQRQLQDAGIDVAALRKAPCSLQVALLPFGEKDQPLLFTGNRTAKDLHAFAVATFPDIVTRISSSTIDSAFGSTMSQPKVVLFTDKEETPGMFRALAASFRKYNLLFFTMRASDEQALKTFNIQKVPAVVLAYLPPGAEEGATGPTQLQLQPYPGPLKYPFLAGWLTMAAQELKLMPEGTASGVDMAGAPAAVPMPEATTSEAFRQHCSDLTGLCIVAALNPSADDFDAHKATLQSVANSRASSALHYLWLDVTRQGAFWEGLAVGRGDTPTAVAISLKKRRQARLDSGAFSEAGLKAFVERLVGGKFMTTPLQEFPIVVDGGQDATSEETQVVEEEFDLSDIMGEQLDAQLGTKEDRLRQLAEQEEEEATRRFQEAAADPPKKKKKRSSKKKPTKTSDEL
ncbi:hypothetical protein ABBQ38_014102 [Trebouxia sp. C0009 RCD-2024]